MRRLLSKGELKEKGISYSDAQLYRLIRAKKFPRPIKLGENRNAWPEQDIDNWIDARIAERDAVAA